MKDALIQKVRDFLKDRFKPGRPLLVGFSGGPDSLALVHALLECKRFFPLDIHLAHIDHGWREESKRQADEFKEKMERLGLAFHLKTLNPSDFAVGNKENKARDLRHAFFQEIYYLIDAQALLLAHQMDDLAETVLKRLFEGAGIFSWSSMQESSSLNGMHLWRPLLSLSKKELLAWLELRGLIYYVVDGTNLDPQFLRGRMRTEIFPYLEELFGKNIVASLCTLSEDAALVTEPLVASFANLAANAKKCLLGTYIDFDQLSTLTLKKTPLFVKYFLGELGIPVSRSMIRAIAGILADSVGPKRFESGKWDIYIERRRLFVSEELPQFSSLSPLKEGLWQAGTWTYEVKWEEVSELKKTSSWQDAFNGQFFVELPQESYFLATHEGLKSLSLKDFLSKRLSSSGVPSFLRSLFPFVIHNDELIHEFLTGKNLKKCLTDTPKRLSIRLFRDQK